MATGQGDSEGARTPNPFLSTPFRTREVRVGRVLIGGKNPIRLQSMTNTLTRDTDASVGQILALERAGANLVRLTAPGKKDAANLERIKKELKKRNSEIPLVADIHFSPEAALTAVEFADKVRINPGNFADRRRNRTIEYGEEEYRQELDRVREVFRPLVLRARELGRALRIGVNYGSLSDRIMNRHGNTPRGMVESALEFIRFAEEENFRDIVVSMKASNPLIMIQAYRLLVESFFATGRDYPLHLGVTEAGHGRDGRIRSIIGIGSLLEDGIGDTIRVSLTEDPVEELPVARRIAERYNQRRLEGTFAENEEGERLTAEHIALYRRIVPPCDYHRRSQTGLVLPESQSAGSSGPDAVSTVRKAAPSDGGADAIAKGISPLRIIATVASFPDFPAADIVREIVDLHERGADLLRLTDSDRHRERLKSLLTDPTLEGIPLIAEIDPDRVVDFLNEINGIFGISLSLRMTSDPDLNSLKKWLTAIQAAGAGLLFLHLLLDRADEKELAILLALPELLAELFPTGGAISVDFAQNSFNRQREGLDYVGLNRLLASHLYGNDDDVTPHPFALLLRSRFPDKEESLYGTALQSGGLLADGIGDVLMPEISGDRSQTGTLEELELALDILQTLRLRLVRTEFISCPSCGRTLFDIQKTADRIRSRTGHLKGVKIAVMGCIVNGPGEMADADFGYVGAGPGRVHLYRERELVRSNIPAEEADEALIDLIRTAGMWREV